LAEAFESHMTARYSMNTNGSLANKLLAPYQGKTILISGAAGYIGSALSQALNHTTCRLILLSRKKLNKYTPPKHRAECLSIQGDVSNRNTWLWVLKDVDYVFHLAAYEHKYGSIYNPNLDLEVNALSILHLLEVCRQERLSPKIIFASSTNLFGMPSSLPVNENFPDNPLTIYAIHKLMAEKYLEYYTREFQQRTVTLRLANLYGPVPDREIATRIVLNRIIQKAVKGETLSLFRNHSCIRDYLFIDDAVNAFLSADSCHESAGQYFVIGSGVGYRISEVVNLVADRVAMRTKYRPEVKIDEGVHIETVELRNFVSDTARFMQQTGWQAQVPLITGIDRTIDFFI
jgi:UDP-glucose 4-epimerase